VTQNQLNNSSAALLLIDHQVGTIGMVRSISAEELKRNVVMLAKAAAILGLPAVISTTRPNRPDLQPRQRKLGRSAS